MHPTQVSPRNPPDLARIHAILGRAIEQRGPRYVIHPGDLAWWAYHSDPRTEHDVSYWLDAVEFYAALGFTRIADLRLWRKHS